MPPGKHDIWGRPVSEYFFSDPANAFFPKNKPIPTTQHAKTVAIPYLQNLFNPLPDTCAMLESVLSLLHHPKELRHLDNTMLLARCMVALQNFTDDLEPTGNKVSRPHHFSTLSYLPRNFTSFSVTNSGFCASESSFFWSKSESLLIPTHSTLSYDERVISQILMISQLNLRHLLLHLLWIPWINQIRGIGCLVP
jgi:hypothetical protein